ncbi:MAG: DUF6544 family protein [Cyclobacteriaceae bacterium]
MIKYLFALLLALHGTIHLMGFIKAFSLANMDRHLKLNISKPVGIAWLLIGLLFFCLVFLYVTQVKGWFYIAFVGALLSQILIFIFWSDAKAATLVNLVIASIALVGYANDNFENRYRQDVGNNIIHTETAVDDLVTWDDLAHLPEPVKKYLEYVDVVGKPKVTNVKITFKGQMRKKEGSWFQFTSEQHNFLERPARLFFMKSKVMGLPAYGYHKYEQNSASMTIKLMSLFDVVSAESDALFKAETVTYFNDMCIFAPSALIDQRIKWRTINDTSVEATYSNQGVNIKATLHFNNTGQLTNFVSDDRYEITDMKQYRFSTPVSDYKNINGYNLASYGEAIWHYPDENFVYGKFHTQDIEYNVTDAK